MKKLLRMCAGVLAATLSVGVVVIAPSTAVPSTAAGASVTVSIDPGFQLQKIDGFGAALIDQVPPAAGRYKLFSLDLARRAEVMDLLFSTSTGAGLSILRFELGAGKTYPRAGLPVDNFTILPTVPTSPTATPSYVWDGYADGQVQIIKDARSRGVPTVYANAWSAPAFMKSNNSVYDGTLCGFVACASGDWRQAYANYLAQYVRSYASSGVTIDYLSPFNEPDLAAPGYQGMSASPAQVASFTALLGSTFSSQGITAKIATADVTGGTATASYQQAIQANSAAASAQKILSFHGYIGDPAADPTALSAGKPSWQTENSCIGDIWNTAYSSGDCSGEYWATRMHSAMNNGVSAYLSWLGAGGHSDNEDLIRVTGTSSYEVSSRLYVMGNYSRYVRPGAMRIAASSSDASVLTTGYRNLDGSFVVVATNTGSTARSLLLSGLSGGTVTPVVTNDVDHLSVKSAITVGNSGVTVTAPADSTITYVFAGSSPANAPTGIVNGATYEIGAVHNGKLASVASSSTLDGANVAQWVDLGSHTAQRWVVTSVGSGYYEIKNVNSNKLLSLSGTNSLLDGANVHQWADLGTYDHQLWQIVSTGVGTYKIVNKFSGKALQVDGGLLTDGANINQATYTGATNQQWRFGS